MFEGFYSHHSRRHSCNYREQQTCNYVLVMWGRSQTQRHSYYRLSQTCTGLFSCPLPRENSRAGVLVAFHFFCHVCLWKKTTLCVFVCVLQVQSLICRMQEVFFTRCEHPLLPVWVQSCRWVITDGDAAPSFTLRLLQQSVRSRGEGHA